MGIAALRLALVASPWGLAAEAHAQGELTLPAPAKDEDASAQPKPLPPDERTGVFHLGLRGGIASPVGQLGERLWFDQVVTGGPSAELSLGIGVGRHASLELSGGFGWLPSASSCTIACEGYTFGGGLALAYHPIQALAIDPTLSFGVGYRGFLLRGTTGASPPQVLGEAPFHAIDFARVAVATDFFPAPFVGIGPVLEADVGMFVDGPQVGTLGSAYVLLSASLRITFEAKRAPRLVPGSTPTGPSQPPDSPAKAPAESPSAPPTPRPVTQSPL